MRILLTFALPMIFLAEALAAQDEETPPGHLGLASALVREVQAIPVGEAGKRDLFVDLASFQQAWVKMGWGELVEEKLRSAIEPPFRTDLEAIQRDPECAWGPVCPFPGNPDIVQVVSLEAGQGQEVRAVVQRQFNVTLRGPVASSFIELEVFFAFERGEWVRVRRGFLRVG